MVPVHRWSGPAPARFGECAGRPALRWPPAGGASRLSRVLLLALCALGGWLGSADAVSNGLIAYATNTTGPFATHSQV